MINVVLLMFICMLALSTSDTDIPDSFDARDEWPFCESIGRIRRQWNCNAGWAFAAITTMADRLCIQTNGTTKVELSPQELLSCCKECNGCNAGYATKAWEYWVSKGIVSGGDYDGVTYEGCQPYSIDTALYVYITTCQERCQSNYETTYEDDKYFGESFYKVGNDTEAIQKEIMTNGPVQAYLQTFEDFFLYKDGVYEHDPIYGTMGYTFVKILGWGTENGTPFWLGASSFGSAWGQLDGFFKIKRGSNEVGIEENVIAGKAKLGSGSDDDNSNGRANIYTASFCVIFVLVFSCLL